MRPSIVALLFCFQTVFSYPSAAQETSGQMREFMSWPSENQMSYIANSVSMIKIVASQTAPSIAKCMDDWYSISDEMRLQRQADIQDAMAKLPNYSPQIIVLAVVEKACGKFERK